jgi:HEAT repeat protein
MADQTSDHAAAHSARQRAAEAATLGLGPRLDDNATRELVAHVESDPDARVRISALGALVRRAPKPRARAAWRSAAADADAAVRRRAAELAPLLSTRATRATLTTQLLGFLADESLVAEAAAFALGELESRDDREMKETDKTRVAKTTRALAGVATGHSDPLVREAAVAALGSIGEPSSLSVVLAATHDKPAIRRRAVLALAAFEGPEVEAAIARAITDTDWQVRQAAEDLTR